MRRRRGLRGVCSHLDAQESAEIAVISLINREVRRERCSLETAPTAKLRRGISLRRFRAAQEGQYWGSQCAQTVNHDLRAERRYSLCRAISPKTVHHGFLVYGLDVESSQRLRVSPKRFRFRFDLLAMRISYRKYSEPMALVPRVPRVVSPGSGVGAEGK